MAQAQLDKKKRIIYKDSSTNTDDKSFLVTLSHSKSIEVYYSKSYREYVVSFNLGSKKFIISKNKWIYFRNFLEQIDDIILNQ